MSPSQVLCFENCPLSFQCYKRWFELEPIETEEDMRFCGECQKPVFRVRSEAEFKSHSILGHCVALDSGIEEIRIGNPENSLYYE